MKKFIFIVGCPRSGTKFIRNILCQHSNISILPETHFFSYFFHSGVIKNIKHLIPFDSEHKLIELMNLLKNPPFFGSYWKYHNDINYDELIYQFKKSDRSYKSLFKLLIQLWASKENKEIGGERTPSNLYHINKLIMWYPNCKVIHIIRDPRSVLASDINMHKKLDYPLSKTNPLYNPGIFLIVFLNWTLATILHKHYKKKYPQNYYLVRFEDLYLKHEATVEQLSNFIGINFEKSMLNPPIVNSSFVGYNNTAQYNPTDAWKIRLPKIYSYLMYLLLKRRMNKFGYI